MSQEIINRMTALVTHPGGWPIPLLLVSLCLLAFTLTVLFVLDRTQGRVERWLFAPQVRIRVPRQAWRSVRSNVVPIEDARRRRELQAIAEIGGRP